MTNDHVLTQLNTKMKSQGRYVLQLFIDGAESHSPELAGPGRYSSIKIVFLPPNTTSILLGFLRTLRCTILKYFYGMCWQRLRSAVQLRRL